MADMKIFHQGDKVSIDGTGQATVLSDEGDGSYHCVIDGIDYEVVVMQHRLSLVKTNDNKLSGGQTSTISTPSNTSTATSSSRVTEPAFSVPEPQPTNSRFSKVSQNDVDALITAQENKNTARKTLRDINLLTQFLATQGETRPIHKLPASILNNLLCMFVVSTKKSDGQEFETNSLRGINSSIERYLRRHCYGYTLRASVEFTKYREVMSAKLKHLKAQGKGNLPNRSVAITDSEIEQLWACQQLGNNTPESILNTVWFNNTVHFGLRGSHEHKQMLWGDVDLKCDSNGSEYLELNERVSKTRQGNQADSREVTPKMWALPDNPDRCPIAMYKMYKSLRPSGYSFPDSPFYVATTTVKNPPMESVWFKRQPVGVHKLECLMKRMAGAAGLAANRKLTNHSARKHLVQKLNDNNVPPSHIMQITGHKNVHSINNYSHISDDQHSQISSILSNSSKSGQLVLYNEPRRDVNKVPALPYAPRHNEVNDGNMPVALPNTSSSNTMTVSSKRDHLQSVFGSSYIAGGSFTINVNNYTTDKRRRPVIESDSESDSQ